MQAARIPLTGFKECDVRGEFGSEITPELAYQLGKAIAAYTQTKTAVIGGDFRLSTPQLMAELKRGLVESGAFVYDLGQLSTPAYYFARRHLSITVGVMVTASHNPAGWNGFKPILGKYPVTPEQVEVLKQIAVQGGFVSGQGGSQDFDIKPEYVAFLAKRFAGLSVKMPKAVMDCGNGATGWAITDVLEALNLTAGPDPRVDVLFGTPDGRFPNRSSDISKPGDLDALQAEVKRRGADLGLGFDGDGDRLGLVNELGGRVSSDQLISWLAQELLQEAPGSAIIYDLKLSKLVPETVERAGGKPVAQKSGHTFIKTSMLDFGAVFGGEYSGHLFFRDLDGGDDALYAALLICTLAAKLKKSISQVFDDMPHYFSTPDIRIAYKDDKEPVLRQTIANAQKQGAKLVLVDGVKAEYAEGWALMRASVTEPAFTLRFEGNTRQDMLNVAQRFLEGAGELGEAVWQQVLKQAGPVG